MKIKILIGALVFLIVINLATIGSFFYHQSQKKQERFLMDRGAPWAKQYPDSLGMEKMRMIHELFRGFRQESAELNAEMMAEQEILFELLQSDAPEDSLYRQLDKLQEMRSALGRKAIDKLIAAKAFLTPEEQKRLFYAIMRASPGFRGGGPPFRKGFRNRRGSFRGPRFDRPKRFNEPEDKP